MNVQVGDKVKYVPSVDYARQVLPEGGRAWNFTTKQKNNDRALSHEDVEHLLAGRRSKDLVPLVPRCCWDAVITAVDGETCDLDVAGPLGGMITHMRNVPHAPATENVPHTWH